MKKNELRKALERELESVQLSDRMKRDILYNAQHSKKPAHKKQTYSYVWAAAAMVVILCASLIINGVHVVPDRVESVPGRGVGPVSAPVAAEGENGGNNMPTVTPEPAPERIDGYIDAKPSPVPATDLFMRYDAYDEVVPAAIGEIVWATPNGRYYHLVSDCSGMQNASETTRNEASLAGKQPCPVCIAFVTPTPVLEEPMPTLTPVPEATQEPAYLFYGTENGTYFHTDETCSGMQNAEWLSDLSGKQPCPVCIPYVTPTPMPVEFTVTPEPTQIPDVVIRDATVTPEPTEMPADVVYDAMITPNPTPTPMPAPMFFGTEHGTYYHINETCSGMENAVWLSDLSGKQPCTVCMGAVTPEPTEMPADVVYDVSATPEPVKQAWYGTEADYLFHRIPDCSGLGIAPELTDLTGKLPCPYCVTYLSYSDGEVRGTFHHSEYYGTEHGNFYHLDEHCSGMKNAVVINELTYKQPCPVCILNADFTPMDASAAPVPVGAEINAIIELNRYTMDNECIMELAYVADAEFKFIDEPDITNWYVDEVESAEYFFEEYLDHRLSDKHIAMLKSTYEEDGKAGYEVRDTLIMLNGVNTEFSSDSGDVPAGREYRFDDTENPFRECVLYVLDRPYEGNTAEVTVVQRLMRWWFDGEKVYRLTKDHRIADEAFPVTIGDGGEVFPIEETLDCSGVEVNATGYALQNNHYAIMEYDESIDLTESELISVSGEVFKADMTTDPTFHVNKVMGWRYPAETADYIDVLRVCDGENSVDVPMNPEGSLSLAIAKLAELLNDCGVTDAETVNDTVASLILLGENGEITAVASQPIREVLRETGLTDDEIAGGYMINSVLAILNGGDAISDDVPEA